MVKFLCGLDETQVRSLAESLDESTIHSQAQCKFRVPLTMLDGKKFKTNAGVLSCSWTRTTGCIHVQCGAAMIDHASHQMQEVCKIYNSLTED